jgi:hypothetical protein
MSRNSKSVLIDVAAIKSQKFRYSKFGPNGEPVALRAAYI